jgi:RHS repeat-associated protein
MGKLVGNARYAIITDHLGTPTAMYDAAGTEVWSASIDVYGNLRDIAGDKQACPFRWPGQYEDPETDLYYNRFRYYDPESGSYSSQDPIRIQGGSALYGYPNDPLHRVDALALSSCTSGETFASYMNSVETLEVTTAHNAAVFYSGPGQRALAEEFALSNGRTTLEATVGGRWLDKQALFGPDSPLTPEEATKVWSRLSERFAENASGNAVGFVDGARPGGIFNTVEYPALRRNPYITNVITGGR